LLAHASSVYASRPVDHVVGRVNGWAVLVKIGGGSALLPRITATGCALGALVAAYAAVAPDPLTGLVSAHVHFFSRSGACRGRRLETRQFRYGLY
jgi:hydroxyethylthiazole kinase